MEDDPDTRTVIRDYLEEVGLRVVSAANGKEAEGKLGEIRPDIVLLDLIMPEMDGVTFLGRLRERPETMGLPVVVCTGKDLDREERLRLQSQASGIVPKGKGFEENLKAVLARFFPLSPGGRES